MESLSNQTKQSRGGRRGEKTQVYKFKIFSKWNLRFNIVCHFNISLTYTSCWMTRKSRFCHFSLLIIKTPTVSRCISTRTCLWHSPKVSLSPSLPMSISSTTFQLVVKSTFPFILISLTLTKISWEIVLMNQQTNNYNVSFPEHIAWTLAAVSCWLLAAVSPPLSCYPSQFSLFAGTFWLLWWLALC